MRKLNFWGKDTTPARTYKIIKKHRAAKDALKG